MSDESIIEYKSVVELTRMTQSQLIAYTKQLQEALFELHEESDE